MNSLVNLLFALSVTLSVFVFIFWKKRKDLIAANHALQSRLNFQNIINWSSIEALYGPLSLNPEYFKDYAGELAKMFRLYFADINLDLFLAFVCDLKFAPKEVINGISKIMKDVLPSTERLFELYMGVVDQEFMIDGIPEKHFYEKLTMAKDIIISIVIARGKENEFKSLANDVIEDSPKSNLMHIYMVAEMFKLKTRVFPK